MTEAVILALIALVGFATFGVIICFVLTNVLKYNPDYVRFVSSYGTFETKFKTKVDE